MMMQFADDTAHSHINPYLLIMKIEKQLNDVDHTKTKVGGLQNNWIYE